MRFCTRRGHVPAGRPYVFVATLLFVALSGPGARLPGATAHPNVFADTARPEAEERDTVVAFVNVNVVPMDREGVVEDQTVVVRDGRIVAVGPADQVVAPVDAIVVDGRGKYLMPGIAEMHAHIPNPNGPGGDEYMENVLFLYVASGITTIRGMLGQPEHLDLRDDVAAGELLAPRIYTSGPSFNGNSVPNPDIARSRVIDQKRAGYDFLKLHPGLSRASYDAIVETADLEEITFAGHVSADVGLERSLEAGQITVDHLDGYAEVLVAADVLATGSSGLFGFNLTESLDEEKIPAVAQATKEAGVWNVPTQSLLENILSLESGEAMANRPEMRYMPPQMVSAWANRKDEFTANPAFTPEKAYWYIEVRRDLIKGLQDAGAGLLLGSDAPQIFQVPGFSALRELEILVEAGLTPYEALATGTVNVAVFLGELDASGTVEEGKVANLILLDENPLTDIRAMSYRSGVMVQGRWVSSEEIETRLAEIASGYGN